MQQRRCHVEEERENATWSWPWDGDHGYSQTCVKCLPLALQTVIANEITIGNCLMHSLKGTVGCDGHN